MTCRFKLLNIGLIDDHRVAHCIVHNTKAIRHDTDTHWVCQSDEAARESMNRWLTSDVDLIPNTVPVPLGCVTPAILTKYLKIDGYRSHVVEWNDTNPSQPRLVRREATDQPQRSPELEVQEKRLGMIGLPFDPYQKLAQEMNQALTLGMVPVGKVDWQSKAADEIDRRVTEAIARKKMIDKLQNELAKQELLGEFIPARPTMLDALESEKSFHEPDRKSKQPCACQLCGAGQAGVLLRGFGR